MTTNEEQELKNISVFIDNKIGRFSSITFPKEITDAMGSGAWIIIQNFIRDGVVADLHTQEYEFTPIGASRYTLLKRKKRNENLKDYAFWLILVCTIIAAGDVIYKWAKKSPSIPESTIQSIQKKERLKDNQIQTLKTDTIKALHQVSLKK